MTDADRKGDWIQTRTGRKFWPLDPRANEVSLYDVAHALAHQCRFTGHSSAFYSVAQHSVLVSRAVPPAAALAGLLHDAAEAYMGDIARPFKRHLYAMAPGAPWERIKAAEHRLLDVILAKFGVPPRSDRGVWDAVAAADETLLVTEARDLMAPLADGWRHTPANGYAALPDPIGPVGPDEARQMFLDRYAELVGRPYHPPVAGGDVREGGCPECPAIMIDGLDGSPQCRCPACWHCTHPSQSVRDGRWVCNACAHKLETV